MSLAALLTAAAEGALAADAKMEALTTSVAELTGRLAAVENENKVLKARLGAAYGAIKFMREKEAVKATAEPEALVPAPQRLLATSPEVVARRAELATRAAEKKLAAEAAAAEAAAAEAALEADGE